MDFDVVIGNPPYNNDLYLDFVQAGYEALKPDGVMVMITPAKGLNGKGGEKNELFRSNIGPHTETICFYPCAQEIFDIRNLDGIAYYVVHKDKTFEKKHIINRSSRVKAFNNEADREIGGQLNNIAYNIKEKVKAAGEKRISLHSFEQSYNDVYEKDCKQSGKYEVISGGKVVGYVDKVPKHECDANTYRVAMQQMLGNGYYGMNGRTVGWNTMYVLKPNQVSTHNYMCIFKSSIDGCNNFISYFNTKLMRFLLMTALIGQSGSNEEAWRFVPDPGAFDHIFTDAELYQKYGLTQDEINIIESVIKERKYENSVP